MDKLEAAIGNLNIVKSALSDAAVAFIQEGKQPAASQVLNHIHGIDEKIKQLTQLLNQLQAQAKAAAAANKGA